MPRHKHQSQLGPPLRQLAKCLQGQGFFWLLGAAGQKDHIFGSKPGQLGQSASHRIGTVGLGAVELHGTGYTKGFRAGAQGEKTFCIRSILYSDPIDLTKQSSHERPKPPIATKTSLAQSAVDHRHLDPCGSGRPNQIGPKFQFHQDQDGGPNPLHSPTHRPGKVQRSIKTQELRIFLPGQGPAGGTSGRKNTFPSRPFRSNAPQERRQQIHLADANRMKPNTGTSILRVAPGHQAQQLLPIPRAIFALSHRSPDQPRPNHQQDQNIDKIQ